MAATMKLLFRADILGFDGLIDFGICTNVFLVVVFDVVVLVVEFAWVHVARVCQYTIGWQMVLQALGMFGWV